MSGVINSILEEVEIFKAENGFIIRADCKTYVAKNWAEVSEALGLYFANPEEARKYFK